jgi:hypothetical protein
MGYSLHEEENMSILKRSSSRFKRRSAYLLSNRRTDLAEVSWKISIVANQATPPSGPGDEV